MRPVPVLVTLHPQAPHWTICFLSVWLTAPARFLPALARIAVDSNEAGGMPLSGMDKEGATIHLYEMKPLLRCQR